MDKSLARYVKFNGYLIFACMLLIVFYETVSLAKQTIYYEQNLTVWQENILIRRHLVGRWIAAVVWLVSLAAYFMAMRWKDAEFLKPAVLVFVVDVLVVLVEDVIRTGRGDGDERFIRDEQCLVAFVVIVAYVMYTMHMLKVLFERSRLEEKSKQCKLNLIISAGKSGVFKSESK